MKQLTAGVTSKLFLLNSLLSDLTLFRTTTFEIMNPHSKLKVYNQIDSLATMHEEDSKFLEIYLMVDEQVPWTQDVIITTLSIFGKER